LRNWDSRMADGSCRDDEEIVVDCGDVPDSRARGAGVVFCSMAMEEQAFDDVYFGGAPFVEELRRRRKGLDVGSWPSA